MQYIGKTNEFLRLTNIKIGTTEILKQRVENGLSIYWNRNQTAVLEIDAQEYQIEPNQLVFITEYHRVEAKQIDEIRFIQFNRPFYCIIDHDSEVGCKGILFFGSSRVPIVTIPEDELEKFEILWRMFCIEMESKDDLQLEMLQTMLKRLLILCTRVYKEQQQMLDTDPSQVDIVREYNFLVEHHFRQKHNVADYADLLNKSAKTLSNLFLQLRQKTPLQIIQDRILLEARRLLYYTDKPIKEIAYEIGFEDIQTFSRFFKNKENISPKDYREQRTLN